MPRHKKKSPQRNPSNTVNEKNGGKNKGLTKTGVSFCPYYVSRNELDTYIQNEIECYQEYGCGSYELNDEDETCYDLTYMKTNPPRRKMI